MDEALHIYSQELWHAPAYVLGTRKSLEQLKLAIDAALENGAGRAESFTSDGEGYSVYVNCVDDDLADRLATPYSDEVGQAQQEGAVWPWTPGQFKFADR